MNSIIGHRERLTALCSDGGGGGLQRQRCGGVAAPPLLPLRRVQTARGAHRRCATAAAAAENGGGGAGGQPAPEEAQQRQRRRRTGAGASAVSSSNPPPQQPQQPQPKRPSGRQRARSTAAKQPAKAGTAAAAAALLLGAVRLPNTGESVDAAEAAAAFHSPPSTAGTTLEDEEDEDGGDDGPAPKAAASSRAKSSSTTSTTSRRTRRTSTAGGGDLNSSGGGGSGSSSAAFAAEERRVAQESVDMPSGVVTLPAVHPELPEQRAASPAPAAAPAAAPKAAAASAAPAPSDPKPRPRARRRTAATIGVAAPAAAAQPSLSSSPPPSAAAAPAALPPPAPRARAPSPAPAPGNLSTDGLDAAIPGLAAGSWTVRFTDSSALRLRRRALVAWDGPGGRPARALVVKKPGHAGASAKLGEIADWLEKRGVETFVERAVHETEFRSLSPYVPSVTRVDFAITLGGDGTVLHLASLFDEEPLPPVAAFAMGTLGFLTPFDPAAHDETLSRILNASSSGSGNGGGSNGAGGYGSGGNGGAAAAAPAPLYCSLRTRKACEVYDAAGARVARHHVLNDAVIDRGSSPTALLLEVYVDGERVTVAEGDGLIVATPSGSTAYSMSAGGPMVSPSVPCTIVTPMSPHSLSFRPLVIPEGAPLAVRVSHAARSHARASFDGKAPCRVPRGGAVRFRTSLCPLPLIASNAADGDWWQGINTKLKWNMSIRGAPPPDGDDYAAREAAAAAAATRAVLSAAAPLKRGGG